ncbi:MAG: hypothetical protein O3C19_04185 [Bacteroidetes bacterium]|nr:hypothetical protein [Bacteroidota bacterium]
MNDLVKYQLERAEDALRQALKLGSDKGDAYLLKQVAEMINELRCMEITSRYNPVSVTADDSIKISTPAAGDQAPYYYTGGDFAESYVGSPAFSTSSDAINFGSTNGSVISFG